MGQSPSCVNFKRQRSRPSTWIDRRPNSSLGVQLELRDAIERGDLEEVVTLLANGASPSQYDSKQQVPLHWAARHGHTDIVRLLIAKGADLVPDRNGQSPLHYASRHGNATMLREIIANPFCERFQTSRKSLIEHMKDTKGHAKMIQFLLNQRMNDGRTCLHLAAQNGHCEAVKVLIEHKADATMADHPVELGRTPVCYALTCNVAQEFLSHSPVDSLAIFFAMRNRRTEVIKLFAGLPVSDATKIWEEGIVQKGQELQSLVWQNLHKVRLWDRLPRIRQLVNGPDEVDVLEFRQPDTPLLRAVWDKYGQYAARGDRSMVNVLLGMGADVEAVTEMGETSIMVAVQARDDDNMLQMLLAYGAMTNKTDQHGQNALHIAAMAGHAKCLRMLLSGAVTEREIHGTTDVGFTPLMLASHLELNQEVIWSLSTAEQNRGCLDIASLEEKHDSKTLLSALTPNRFFLVPQRGGSYIVAVNGGELLVASMTIMELLDKAARFELVDSPQKKNVLIELMEQTKGPMMHAQGDFNAPTSWSIVDNRCSYRADLAQVLNDTMSRLAAVTLEEMRLLENSEGGRKLVEMQNWRLMSRPLHQNDFHPEIPGLREKDLKALISWSLTGGFCTAADLVQLVRLREFTTIKMFWTNIYKHILVHFAGIADESFHSNIRRALGNVRGAEWRSANLKGIPRMMTKEVEYGEVGDETFEQRTAASRIVDINRGSYVCSDPEELHEVCDIIESWTIRKNRMRVLRRNNGFARGLSLDYRDVKFIIEFEVLGQDWTFLGEIQLILPTWLKLKRAMHLLYRLVRGDYDHMTARGLWAAWTSIVNNDYKALIPKERVVAELQMDRDLVEAAEDFLGCCDHWGYQELHEVVCHFPHAERNSFLDRLIEVFFREPEKRTKKTDRRKNESQPEESASK